MKKKESIGGDFSWGIWGKEMIEYRFEEEIEEREGMRVVEVCYKKKKKEKDFWRNIGIKKDLGNKNEFMEDKEIDEVYIE